MNDSCIYVKYDIDDKYDLKYNYTWLFDMIGICLKYEYMWLHGDIEMISILEMIYYMFNVYILLEMQRNK